MPLLRTLNRSATISAGSAAPENDVGDVDRDQLRCDGGLTDGPVDVALHLARDRRSSRWISSTQAFPCFLETHNPCDLTSWVPGTARPARACTRRCAPYRSCARARCRTWPAAAARARRLCGRRRRSRNPTRPAAAGD